MLDLSHNQLSFVPPDLPETLEELHLQGNRIGHIGSEAFLSTPRLRALFLRCAPRVGAWCMVAGWALSASCPHARAPFPPTCRANRLHLTSISAEAFLGLPHLRVVDTAGNPEQVLVRLPPKTTRAPRAGGS